jgi:hypothetical protein
MSSLCNQHFYRGILKGARQVRLTHRRLRLVLVGGSVLSRGTQDCRLEAAERECVLIWSLALQFPQHRPREANLFGTALSREALERRAAWVPQSQQVCHFVERLASCIVERLSQETVFPPGGNVEQHGMTPAHQQSNERGLELRILEDGRKEVPFEMIYP